MTEEAGDSSFTMKVIVILKIVIHQIVMQREQAALQDLSMKAKWITKNPNEASFSATAFSEQNEG